jgi:predicted DNA-binding antitoxin AbrB/MazE fold protein
MSIHQVDSSTVVRKENTDLPSKLMESRTMALKVEAVYEDGVLKPERSLPLRERQRVIITVQEQTTQARITYGLIAWKGDPETLRRIAEDPELRVMESP